MDRDPHPRDPARVGPPEGSPLAEAMGAILERQENYGRQVENFSQIAALWRELFGWEVTPEDVALAMICVKLSRLQRTPGHLDSQVDIAGYTQTYWMIRNGR